MPPWLMTTHSLECGSIGHHFIGEEEGENAKRALDLKEICTLGVHDGLHTLDYFEVSFQMAMAGRAIDFIGKTFLINHRCNNG